MALLERLSTDDVPPPHRMSYWNDVSKRLIAPIRVEARGSEPFEAEICRWRLRDCEILSPSSTPAHIYSAPEHRSADALNVQLQHRGRTVNYTGGRRTVLEEGDFVLFDPSEPLWLTFARPTRTILLRLPRAAVEERMPHLRRKVGVPVSGRHGAGALFAAALRQAWAELNRGGEGKWSSGLSDVLWPLLDMAYAPVESDDEAGRRDALRGRIFAAIHAELADPMLDVHALAARVGVTPRYVQMLFAELGTTPSEFIKTRRLERAARRLERAGGGTSVTEVAYETGFSCLNSFCRAFKRHFGVAPNRYRRG